ncbi:FtsX-like permease family protein [Lapidilactobacillus luobeiensis]|uniref:FtsX-like permease family protein n=1 Tax=Lapidilactobacillus luobeiensis TaxID=2950371 RepID=UPI0021C3EAE4|nr:ABC transporter permease [Lapidilactobacillus luobeiensis]
MKYFEFIHHVFLKRVVFTILGLLFMMAFALISFVCVRSMVSVTHGYRDLATMRGKKVVAGNDRSDQDKLVQAYQENPEQVAEHVTGIINSLEKSGDYALHWSYDAQEKFANADRSANLPVKFLTANQNFFQFYPLGIAQGKNLTVQDFHQNRTTIPVLVGANLASIFPVGHQFKATDPSSGRHEVYRVRGVLQQNQSLRSMYLLESETRLNNTIVRPLRAEEVAKISPFQLSSGLQDLLLFDTAARQLPEIRQKINQDQIFNVKFYSVDDNINQFLTLYRQEMLPLVLIMLVILTGTSAFMIWNIIKTIKDSRQEVALRLALGLTPRDVFHATFMLTCAEAFLALVPAGGFALLLTKFLKNDNIGAEGQLTQATIIGSDDLVAMIIVFVFLVGLALLVSWLAQRTVRRKLILGEVN